MGKKNALETEKLKGKDNFFRFLCPCSKLRTENIPIVKEQISYVKKSHENINKNDLDKWFWEEHIEHILL